MKKFMYALSIASIFVYAGIILLGTIWLVWPYKTIEIQQKIQTTKTSYTSGDILMYLFDYCKYTHTNVSINRAFIDGVIYSMPDVTANNPQGCRKQIISISIPNLPSGKYMLRLQYTYKVNPLREITKTYFTNQFTIREK